MEENNNRKYISVQELATRMGISRIAVFKKIKNGEIPAEKIGRSYAISINDVSDLMSSNTLSDTKKEEIEEAVERVVKEYGDTLKLLGKE